MRLFVASLALLGLSSGALAQDRGSLAFDLMTTPGRHAGFGIYVTDALSVRPSLGLGFSSEYGTEVNVGADLRYELLASRRVSPYATAGISYNRNPYIVQYDAGGALLPEASSDVVRYGAGIGLRTRVKYGISLVGEGRIMNSELRDVAGGYQAVRNGAHFEAALGVSYTFH